MLGVSGVGCALPTPRAGSPRPIKPVLEQAYYILDELILGGELQETNKREVLRVCAQQDDLMEADDTVRRPR
jgi:hypothetical protein